MFFQSSEIASAAYNCPWYLCSLRFRRALLVVMVRSKRDTRLTAGGLTTLSLACFTAVRITYKLFMFSALALLAPRSARGVELLVVCSVRGI